jgi:hypothetical protein
MKAKTFRRSLIGAVLVWTVTVSGQPVGLSGARGWGWSLAFAQSGPPGGPPPGSLPPNDFGLRITQQLATNATDFPAISTTPGLTFQYDPQTQLFERSSRALGPIFVERARTLGRGKFELGVSYIYIHFDELDGDKLEGLVATRKDAIAPGVDLTLTFDQFSLEEHVIPFFGTYGVTDRWDVNFLIPLLVTSFDSRVRIGVGPQEILFGGSREKTGPGDLFLRTKYRLFDYEGFNLAFGSSLRLPTGDEDELQGKGDVILEPFFALDREHTRFNLHITLGIDFNIDDSDRSRIRYAGGVAFDLIEQLAVTVDVIGNSSLKTDRISGGTGLSGNAPPGLSPTFTAKRKTDIVDLALGLKGSVRSLTGFVTFFLPLNNDGLRADWIPALGLQYSF